MSKQIDLKALLESKMGNIQPVEETRTAIEAVERSVPKNLMFDAESTEFKPETKAISATISRGLTVEEAKQFDDDMNRFIDTVLISGVDYGVIPHCNKPTLLKSGAEKIMNYLGLIARTEVVNRVEDHNTAFFSYECKVFLIDYNGVVKGEGVGICNSREGRYAKQNGYAVQNTVLKMAKKRALVDSVLNVGNLSARFTQDIEDMNIEPEQQSAGKSVEELRPNNNISSTPNTNKPATKKQIYFLETLMGHHGTTVDAMNKYVSQQYGVDDYRKISGYQASQLIERYKSLS
ncbi:MAG: regulatory protein GemA [Eubacterium sp.]|nr:regulatory protein GemA [Eubacterium sp.]